MFWHFAKVLYMYSPGTLHLSQIVLEYSNFLLLQLASCTLKFSNQQYHKVHVLKVKIFAAKHGFLYSFTLVTI